MVLFQLRCSRKGKSKTIKTVEMVVVARGMGVVRIIIQRVWGYEGIVLYLSFEGSYTNSSIIELHRTVHQKKKVII